ncbi:MAG: (Fe-S)-binding protein [Promethearchaeota archaeon]|nr:MAG: (Fe-S)-binding protein [Candidatus Lokiarchaeota archaeon]
MFNENTCQQCGTCLEQCPFLQLPKDQAKEEISLMIKTRNSRKILKNCAGCSYCDTICPTNSNPSALRKDIRLKHIRSKGISSLAFITQDMPNNLMSISLEVNTEEKKRDIEKYSNPMNNEAMFYLGCGIPYIFPDLAKTKLLGDLPLLGGMKNCCGGYVYNFFGEEEAKIKGNELLDKIKNLGIKKLISFCPDCEKMIQGVYPSILEGFNIESQTIVDYLIEKYHKGELNFRNKVNQRITFQDPCPWRKLDKKIYDGPREFLEIIGAEVVEMKHNRKKSLCCGAPVAVSNRPLGKKIAKMKISEAKDVGAEAIAFICTGCLFGLAKYASIKNIESYYITELAQMAIGEKPSHQIVNTIKQMENHLFKKVGENPTLMTDRYLLKNGKIVRI